MGFRRVSTRATGRLQAHLGPALLLVLMVGCAGDAKADRAVTAYEPQPADDQAQVATFSEQSPQEEPPAGKTDDKPVKAQSEQPPADGQTMDEAQRKALEDMIRKAITEEMARSATEKKSQKDVREAKTSPAPTQQQPAAPGKTAAVNTGARKPQTSAAAKKGCGATRSATRVDLTPPPPDQPQPKFVCAQTKIESKSLWQGEKAQFAFKVRNGGEGALAIRLKGG